MVDNLKICCRECCKQDSMKIMEMICELRERMYSFEGMKFLEDCYSYSDVFVACSYMKSSFLPKDVAKQYIYFCYNEEDKLIGCITIRPELEHPELVEYAGHIGFAVRPLEQNKGYGGSLLKEALRISGEVYKMDKVMVSCRESNHVSSKVIEKCGGILENIVYISKKNEHYKRYWIE